MTITAFWICPSPAHLRYSLSDGSQYLYEIDRARGDEPPDWLLREAHAAMGDGGTRSGLFVGYDRDWDEAAAEMDKAYERMEAA